MVPPSTEPDTKQTVDIDEQALYKVVRSAVEDAILGVLGTILLLGIAVFLVWAGGALLISEASPVGLGLGVVFLGFGLYLGAATLGLVPPYDEWISSDT
jgi:hypothetical protein